MDKRSSLPSLLNAGPVLWWLILGLNLGLLAAALYWQYALGDEPCQVCVHARLWVVAIILLSTMMLFTQDRRWSRALGLGLLALSSLGLGERAFYLYEIENFKGDGSCEFTLGMPDWLAVDRWFPALFEVRNICSYTPEIAFGISMAEGLLACSFAMAITSLVALVRTLKNKVHADNDD